MWLLSVDVLDVDGPLGAEGGPPSLSLSPPGWWARLRCPPGDAGQGSLHPPLRAPKTSPAAAMARLAAALWSLCVTAVLVTSATQGRCCRGRGWNVEMPLNDLLKPLPHPHLRGPGPGRGVVVTHRQQHGGPRAWDQPVAPWDGAGLPGDGGSCVWYLSYILLALTGRDLIKACPLTFI